MCHANSAVTVCVILREQKYAGFPTLPAGQQTGKQRFTEKMKSKIDTATGRAIYGMRLAVGEPPFAHTRSVLKLDRFTLRGKKKVNAQWNRYCVVHNLKRFTDTGRFLPDEGKIWALSECKMGQQEDRIY